MDLQQLFEEIVAKPVTSLSIILNLIVIESLLSVDNAAVLATIVLDLNKKDRKKALKYGILGAYIFRGICLLLASVLVTIWWLKPLGGIYLLYLCIKYFIKKPTVEQEELEAENKVPDKQHNWVYRHVLRLLGPFWSTVVLIELVDLTFSIDNVFAAVAFTDNILLIWIGVFIGILAMRYVASGFVKLIEHYPFLETAAFVVIGLLGVKLVLSLYEYFYPETGFSRLLISHAADWGTSIVTIGIFALPLLTSVLFNYPKKH